MRGRALATLAVCFLLGMQGVVAREEVTVFLDRPDPFEPAFGEVTMEAVVQSPAPVERVVFYVDGVAVGELREAPYQWTADVGQDNLEHTFEVIAYAADGRTGSARLRTPKLRVDEEVVVSLQQLYVTATTGGSRVLDLERGEFVVEDEGRRQRLVTFARGDIPFTATVLIDSSRSMEGDKLAAAVAGARAFVAGMKPLDEARLLVFSDRVLHATPVSTFPEVLTLGLGSVTARGGSAVGDHLYLALRQLEERQGRRVAVLLSDGVDSHSVLSPEMVLERARHSQALTYWLRIPYGGWEAVGGLPHLASTWRAPEDYRRHLERLEQTVAESGGRTWQLTGPEEIEPAFREILEELREQYVLGYYPSGARGDGRFRRVTVEVARPGVELRSQRGYVDD